LALDSPALSIFGLKAFGFLSKVCITASYQVELFGQFSQPKQLQSGAHPKPAAKQSQYSFKHFDFLQLHLTLKEGV
jgi:hypothetical protein